MENICLFCGITFISKRKRKYCIELHRSYHWRKENPDRTRENRRAQQTYARRKLSPEQRAVKRIKQTAHAHTINGRYSTYKSSAKSRGLEFKLTLDEFRSFLGKSCVYCGSNIQNIGIDRMDNNSGYTLENSVPCCITCNRMKMNHSLEEFLQQCKKIVLFTSKETTTIGA